MAKLRSYLMSRAKELAPVSTEATYDEKRQLNVLGVASGSVPLILADVCPPTHSKTMAAPGDDDPDEDDERCY